MAQSNFLKACRGRPVKQTPVWFMRQAGRYLPEYRELRKKYSMLELCRIPDLAVEVTLQPIRRFPLDAAIIFADILLPLPVMGVSFEFVAGKGPSIEQPLREPAQVDRLRVGEPESDLDFVLKALRLARLELSDQVALIGFAGAPFTLASYMIEGGYSRNFLHTKGLMYSQPESWHQLMRIVTEVTIRYLRAQIEAGAQAVQLFDSWVGALSPHDYQVFVLPYSQQIFEGLAQTGVPAIHFGTGTAGFLELFHKAGGSVHSIGWRIPLAKAWQVLGSETVLQGNLDPVVLTAPREVLKERVLDVLLQAEGRAGHIFNLGHGILPHTPPENVARVVDWVHSYSVDSAEASP